MKSLILQQIGGHFRPIVAKMQNKSLRLAEALKGFFQGLKSIKEFFILILEEMILPHRLSA